MCLYVPFCFFFAVLIGLHQLFAKELPNLVTGETSKKKKASAASALSQQVPAGPGGIAAPGAPTAVFYRRISARGAPMEFNLRQDGNVPNLGSGRFINDSFASATSQGIFMAPNSIALPKAGFFSDDEGGKAVPNTRAYTLIDIKDWVPNDSKEFFLDVIRQQQLQLSTADVSNLALKGTALLKLSATD